MQRRRFGREFKVEAVRLIKERGVAVAQAARDLDVHENVLRKWVKELSADPAQAFPGAGQMKPDQLEIDRLRREVSKLKAERDILKNHRGSVPPVEGETARCHTGPGRERPSAFWWRLTPLKTWSMGCRELESGDVLGRSD